MTSDLLNLHLVNDKWLVSVLRSDLNMQTTGGAGKLFHNHGVSRVKCLCLELANLIAF